MTQVKILVNNIQDVSHRAAAETELNVYLKTGWKVHNTHQHMDNDNNSLMLTTILTKEGDEAAKTESNKQEIVKPKENSVTKTDQQNTVKGAGEEKEETKEGEEENKDASATEPPKGFKVKEKKENSETAKKEEETSKTSEDKTVTKEIEEHESDETEESDAEEKNSEKE